MEDFSVVCIARNEMSCIARLTASLKGVDDLVLLDTGSTDGTPEWAEKNGWRVIRAGEQFKYTATQDQVDKFKRYFGFDPSFKAGDKYFHFADARNEALKHAKHDWCFQPDIDEIPDWNLEQVRKDIQNEDQLVYRFCFQHNADGSCGLEFSHCKFFRRSKVKWVNQVHEIHAPRKGCTPKPAKWTDSIYHHHWQNKETQRGGYIKGLELDVTNNFNNDRNLYYLGREYFWAGEFLKAIQTFNVAFKKMWWEPEIGQAYIWKSLSHQALGEEKKALRCLHTSLKYCDTRREPFYELGEYYFKQKKYDQAITWWQAAVNIPFRAHGYLNNKDLYGWKIHDKLAVTYSNLNAKDKVKEEWLKCLKFEDCPRVILESVKMFYPCPLISIVVPTCRPEGFKRLVDSIKKNTTYPNYEIVERAEDGTAVEKFNNGVDAAKGDLVVFIADDCEVELGWLTQAYAHFKEEFREKGLVIFNDNHWHGTLANHFLVSKNVREELDGYIWCPEYKHCSVDVELHIRLTHKNLISYCPQAKIIHKHYYCTSKGAKPDRKDKWYHLIDSYTTRDRKLLPLRLKDMNLLNEAYLYSDWLLDTAGYPKGSPAIDLRKKFREMDIIPIGTRVLNIGIGEGTSGLATQLPYFFFKELTHVEPHIDYVEKDQIRKYNTEDINYIEDEIQTITDFSGYDLLLAFDVLEHLKKDESLAVLDKMEASNAGILIFIPLETEPRANTFEVKSQDHLSFWTEHDFIKRGYKTKILPDFHNEGGKTFPALWCWRKNK